MKHIGRTGALLALVIALSNSNVAQAEEPCIGAAAAKACRDGVIAQIKGSRYSTKKGGFLPQGYSVGDGMTMVSTMPLQANLPACKAVMREKGGRTLRLPHIFGFCIEIAAGGKIGRIIQVK